MGKTYKSFPTNVGQSNQSVSLFILQPDYAKIAQYCNIWRNYNDIGDSWDSVNGIITFYGDDNTSFAEVAAPGSFNDPDMVSCLLSISTFF